MRIICFAVLFCFIIASNVSAQQFSPLHLFEAVPSIVKQLTDESYTVWATDHNRAAYRGASLFASEALIETEESVRTDSTTSESNNLGRNNFSFLQFDTNQRRRVNWSRGYNRSVTTTFSQDRWSGGPVMLLNPYCRD